MSQGQSSTTEHNRMVYDREDGEETAQGRVSQGQGSTTEHNRMVSDREDRKTNSKTNRHMSQSRF